MKQPQLKKLYGDDYPTAVVRDGIRMPLQRETRFSRYYHSPEHRGGHLVSRFMDDSASITAVELALEWPGWNEDLKSEFCQECGWLHKQPDFPDMLRFIASQGSTGNHWSGIAQQVAIGLPQEEAFEILVRVLRDANIGRTANISQAMAITKHPAAEAKLREHLTTVWAHPDLWKDDEFSNWVAFDATTCIGHLLDLGAPAADFEAQARRLSEHVCSGNRRSCRTFLLKQYPWLK